MPFPDDADPANPSDRDRLRLAFAVHVALDIVNADGVVDVDEVRLLLEAFPSAWLDACGFLDADGQLTEACDAAYAEALAVLPGALNVKQKLELVTLFHQACVADGQMDERELEVLHTMAARLGIGLDILNSRLRDLNSGGTLVPPVRRK